MNIIADKHLFNLHSLLPEQCKLTLFDPNDGLPKSATEYDALLIRTVTKINPDTLPTSGNLKFVGSASAGHDHVDRDHLNRLNIRFTSAAGCNANAVAEYIITVLFRWASIKEVDVYSKKIGVIGCGHTGGSVITLLEKLGIDHVKYDPPRAEKEKLFRSASLNELLQCDILSFHTPFTQSGKHATHHLCDSSWLNHGYDLLINAARGGVVNEKDLLAAKQKGKLGDFILDVWEDEPLFNDQMANLAFIATPHIAGYSKEAKFRASKLVVDGLLDFFRLESPEADSEKDLAIDLHLSNTTFPKFLWNHHKIDFYDGKLRKLIGQKNHIKSINFGNLRSETPLRNEFGSYLRSLEDTSTVPKEFLIFRQ